MTERGGLVNSFDTILFSCDDISWEDEDEYVRFRDVIQNLKQRGKKVLYVTTDTSSRRQICRKLSKLGIEVDIDSIACMSYLLAKYLQKNLSGGKVFVVDSTGISEELTTLGIRNFGAGPDVLKTELVTLVRTFELETDLDAVVVAFDEHLSYPKLFRAATYLNNSNVKFIATSVKQPVKPFVTSVECCSDRKALIFEDSEVFQRALYENFDITPEKTLLVVTKSVGDISLGKRCGVKTLLVSNNKNHRDSSESGDSLEKTIPDFCVETLTDILHAS